MPGLRRRRIVMEEGEGQREALGIGTIQARAPKHDVTVVLEDVRMNAVPQEFNGTLVAVGCQHTRAAELEELQIAMTRNQGADVEFTAGVKAAKFFGQRLPQQPVSADNARPIPAAIARGMIDHQQVIANRVISVDIAAGEKTGPVTECPNTLVKKSAKKHPGPAAPR